MNGQVNDCEAGDLRRYRARYDITIMTHLSEIAIDLVNPRESPYLMNEKYRQSLT